MMRNPIWLAALAAIAMCATAGVATAQSVQSPDATLRVDLATGAQGPRWTLRDGGRVLIAPSLLGLEFERYRKLAPGMVVQGVDERSGVDRYTLPAGKQSAVADPYNEIIVHLAEPDGSQRRLDVVLRAYDTGVALRYVIPAQPNLSSLRLVNEMTQFAFASDYACHGLNLGSFGTSHEGEYDPVAASAIRPHNLYELPLVCSAGADAPTIAIAEAAVETWPAMYLTGTETGDLGVAARLTRQPGDPDIAVAADLANGAMSPWRVVMVADHPGQLIENTLLTSLNPPARGDFSWVRPGKFAWDWWSGPVLTGVPQPGTNMATEMAFIDFAARLHLPYMMVDDGWYVNSGDGATLNPGADPTRPIEAIDMPALVAYGRQRDVGILLWIHWALLDRDMDRILDQVAAWGAKGIKVDFMNRDDQAMIGFYHRLAAATARHHLLLDLHGATHPWGMTRTYPNFLTQEGVLGAEYNKWTRRITARHNVTLAYTRMLAGPMDYTPGGYRNRTPDTFAIQPVGPETQTTRGHGLAMYVVYESPLQSVADSPDAYRGEAGLDFLADVPASWDETRFLAGELGAYIVLARRKGRTWYLGAMTDAARTVRVPLSFLGRGTFDLKSWTDGAGPTDLVVDHRTIAAGDTLSLTLGRAGGGVAVFRPAN